MNLSEEKKQIWIKFIKRKLSEKKPNSLSDYNLERCFKNCVAKRKLINLSKEFRDSGILTMKIIKLINYPSP